MSPPKRESASGENRAAKQAKQEASAAALQIQLAATAEQECYESLLRWHSNAGFTDDESGRRKAKIFAARHKVYSAAKLALDDDSTAAQEASSKAVGEQIAAACRQSLGNKASFGVISNKLKLLPAPTMEMANIVADSFGHISQCDMCFTQLQKLNNYQDSIATADMLMTARCGSHLVKRLTCVKKTLMECCLWSNEKACDGMAVVEFFMKAVTEKYAFIENTTDEKGRKVKRLQLRVLPLSNAVFDTIENQVHPTVKDEVKESKQRIMDMYMQLSTAAKEKENAENYHAAMNTPNAKPTDLQTMWALCKPSTTAFVVDSACHNKNALTEADVENWHNFSGVVAAEIVGGVEKVDAAEKEYLKMTKGPESTLAHWNLMGSKYANNLRVIAAPLPNMEKLVVNCKKVEMDHAKDVRNRVLHRIEDPGAVLQPVEDGELIKATVAVLRQHMTSDKVKASQMLQVFELLGELVTEPNHVIIKVSEIKAAGLAGGAWPSTLFVGFLDEAFAARFKFLEVAANRLVWAGDLGAAENKILESDQWSHIRSTVAPTGDDVIDTFLASLMDIRFGAKKMFGGRLCDKNGEIAVVHNNNIGGGMLPLLGGSVMQGGAAASSSAGGAAASSSAAGGAGQNALRPSVSRKSSSERDEDDD